MDSAVQLALMMKLKAVFEVDGKFMGFPVVPHSFPSAGLKTIVTGVGTGAELQLQRDFIRTVNAIPDGGLVIGQGGRFLWDAYFDVMSASPVQLARGALSDDDEERLQAAKRVLYKDDDDTTRPTRRHRAYLQIQDLWLQLQRDFRLRQSEVEASNDLRLKDFWQRAGKKVYEDRILELEERWRREGFRAEIDEAWRVVKMLSASDPQRSWTEWAKRFVPEVDLNGDLNLIKFAQTGFTPVNFMESTWSSFTLTQTETQSLLARAPEPLRSRFGGQPPASDFVSVSFEYSPVTIERAWFEPKVFSARFWQFENPARRLSDGAKPPKGELPGYISTAVFIRNLAVARQASGNVAPTSTTPPVMRPPRLPPRLDFGRILDHLRDPRGPRSDTTVIKSLDQAAILDLQRNMVRGTGAPGAGGIHSPIMVGPALRAGPVRFPFESASAVLSADERTLGPAAIPKAGDYFDRIPDLDHIRTQIQDALRAANAPVVEPSVAAAGTSDTQRAYTGGEIAILAFVWSPFPKCPNPDPDLEWE